MFAVSFDDISWDPAAAPVETSEAPPDLEFANEFASFIDSEFSFPEDDFVGETRSKRTRTEVEAKEPFFRSPFKQSAAKTNPFDLDDLLGGSEKTEVLEGELSADDFYDSETTSEGGYSCDDTLLDEISQNVDSWYAASEVTKKSSSKITKPGDWSNFDFTANNIFGNDQSAEGPASSHETRGASGKLKKSKNQGSSEQKKRRKGSETGEELSSTTSSTSSRRRRRKVDMEQLRTRISNLVNRKVTDAPVNADEELSVREAIISTFFHYRSNNMSDKNRWSELVSDDFTMMLPRTPYRAQPDDMTASGSSTNVLSDIISEIRTVFGIDALVNDTASVHGMVEVIRSRVRAQKPELARKRAAGFALNILLDDNSLKLDESSGAFKATWSVSTHGLVSAGFSSECAVEGVAMMRFDASYKLVALELEFDSLSFGRQLQRHKLLDPLQLVRQNAALLGAGSPANLGGKVAIGVRGAGGVLAPSPMGARPSAAFMKSFGQACAAVKQASEAVAAANGTTPTNSPPSPQRVMQLMALNMQLMQANGAGGVLLPTGGSATTATAGGKKGKTESTSGSTSPAPSPTPTAATIASVSSSPPIVAAPASSSQPSKQGKKRSAPVAVTEVGTASADSLDLFGLARQMTSVPPILSTTPTTTTIPKPITTTTESRPVVNQSSSTTQSRQQPLSSMSQHNNSTLLPTTSGSQLPTQQSTMSMPPMQFQTTLPSSFAPEQMRNFMNVMPPPPQASSCSSNTFPAPQGPSNDSIRSLFPYGLPSASQLGNGNLNLGNNVPPPPLSASQLSQMFGLLQNTSSSNTNSSVGSNNNTQNSSNNNNNMNNQFLGFLPPHLASSTPFPPLGSLGGGLNNDHLSSFCPPPLPNLPRP